MINLRRFKQVYLDHFVPRDEGRIEHVRKLVDLNGSDMYAFQKDTGEILSLFGTVELAPDVVELWQCPSTAYNKYALGLFKETLNFIYGYLPDVCDRVIVTISEKDGKLGHKWAVRIGGRPYMNLPKFRDGVDHTLYLIELGGN